MKVLNFSKVEILPALLDKSKTQTIRKAWDDSQCSASGGEFGECEDNCITCKWAINAIPPRFKVGEQVKLMWNQRSKYQIFCKMCGVGLEDGMNPNIIELTNSKNKCGCVADLLYKELGIVKITEVFKIKMNKETCHHFKQEITFVEPAKWGKTLAEKDGFKSAEDMFTLLDKMYDLSTPKEFWIYRWKWQSHKKGD